MGRWKLCARSSLTLAKRDYMYVLGRSDAQTAPAQHFKASLKSQSNHWK